jgi:hypothetical protein
MVQRYENNKYARRLSRKKIRIPKELAPKIANNKQLIRVCSIYLELKPLFYNSLIKDYRANYQELSEYLGIGNSTFRSYINRMVNMGLAKKQGNHLILASWRDFRDLFSIETRKIHKVDNGYQMGLIIRVLAIDYNLKKQDWKFWRKYFIEDQYNRYCEGELAKFRTHGQKIALETKERFAKDLLDKIERKKVWKEVFRQFKEDPYNLGKAVQRSLKEYSRGADIPSMNPAITLSCRGIAKIFGRRTAGAGFYWSRKLEIADLLIVHPISIRSNDKVMARQNLEEISLGAYSRKIQRNGKKVYFQRLCNQIACLIPE